MSGICISSSTAYRVAKNLGVKGKDTKTTKYQEFWETINWELPDLDLSRIWNVDRGNIRQKRVFLEMHPPVWHKTVDSEDKEYKKALRKERKKAKQFAGHVPS
jgi:hypothetical protein